MCHDAAPYGMKICPDCFEKLPFIKGDRCGKCGKPVAKGEIICPDCGERDHVFESGYAAFVYDDTMRRAMSFLKYGGRREYAPVLGGLTADEAGEWLKDKTDAVIVPIPLHKKRERKRGYNQAALIAKEIAVRTGLPLDDGCLVRTKKTAALKDLDPEERRKAMEDAFDTVHGKKMPNKVIIVDDIYTTGMTMDAAAKALKAAGAKACFALSVCIGRGIMIE